jgi:hypothetical protein
LKESFPVLGAVKYLNLSDYDIGMPLHTDKLEKSPAVRYAIKQYRKPQNDNTAKNPSNEVKVVKIKKQPIKKAIEDIKKYFS